MIQVIDRREFIKQSTQATGVIGLAALGAADLRAAPKQLFKISLAQWSFHKALFNKELDNLDFARTAKQNYGITAVEYVNQFFKDKAEDKAHRREISARASTDRGRQT